MKRSFKLENLDCANCAAKMEVAINKIPGVKKATINFMAQKLVIDAEDDKFEDILRQAQTAITKVNADCVIVK